MIKQLTIAENISLKELNTFGIDASAHYLATCSTVEEYRELLSWKGFEKNKKLILGGGSNILFTQDFDGLVIKNGFKGKEIVEQTDENIYVKVGAGENWHQFVLYCVENGYGGIENLSLIPGNVGASPMQNIGAYGVEIKDVFQELEAIELNSGEIVKFTGPECNFGYRESVFKNKEKDKFIISSVTYRLNKKPTFNTSYGAIEQELENMGVEDLSIAAISQAVINIRSSKLPNPKEIGNAGSFFKNPVVPNTKVEELIKEYPNMPSYSVDEGNTKLAAGWLIEQCGWKGKRIENYGVHAKQALVLVNYGGAKGSAIWELSEDIKQSVVNKFGVQLEREVNII